MNPIGAPTMHRTTLALAFAVLPALVGWSPAVSQGAVTLDPKAFCVKDGSRFKIDPRLFADEILDKYKISRKCERAANGSQNLLAAGRDFDYGKCDKGDEESVNGAKNRVRQILNGETLRFGVEKIKSDHRHASELNERDFFKSDPGIAVYCLTLGQTEKSADKPKKSVPTVGSWTIKLRGDQASLEPDQGTDKFKKEATSAQVAVSDNRLNDRVKYNVKAAVGLDTGLKQFTAPGLEGGTYRFIPYAKFENQFATPKGSDKEIDLITLGSITTFLLRPEGSPLSSRITLDPQYIMDGTTEARFFATTLKWYPTLELPSPPGLPPGVNSFPPGDVSVAKLFYYHIYLAGILNVSQVLDSGSDPKLDQTKNFVYYGPEARLVLTGYPESFLEPFKIDLKYFHLWGSGPQDIQPERFVATLTYSLDKDGNYDFNVSWDTGHDYETLTKRRLLTTSIGLKF